MRVSQADRVKSIMVPFEPSGPKPLGHDVNLRKTTRTHSVPRGFGLIVLTLCLGEHP